MPRSPVNNQTFRMRGENMTRIETFVAAAFAFAVTMLVISLGTVPSTFEAFIVAVKQIPSFAASCATIFWIWHSHANWCRRYGLEDGPTIVLSGLLIFLVLIYIYPLRLMMQGLFYTISGGFFPMEMSMESFAQLRFMFAFYALGFLLLCCNFMALNYHALRKAEPLELSKFEVFDTQSDVFIWVAAGTVCCLSLLGAAILSDNLIPLCGFCYFLLFPVLFSVRFIREKQRKELSVSNREPAEQ